MRAFLLRAVALLALVAVLHLGRERAVDAAGHTCP